MAFHIPFPPSDALPTRNQRIIRAYPQAQSAINTIERTSKDLPYGTPISSVLANYHFLNAQSVFDFFSPYLIRKFGAVSDEAMIYEYMRNTINCLPDGAINNEEGRRTAFALICEEISREIYANSMDGVPTVNLILGPPGSGKTAFSKSLFTVSLRGFWNKKIIPCRVEYSKFYSTDKSLDERFFSFVRRCQFRDLMIYVFYSGIFDEYQKKDIISRFRFSDQTQSILKRIVNDSENLSIDCESLCIDTPFRTRFNRLWHPIKEGDRDRILYDLSSYLELKYLVSFDGFDSIYIEHYLFGERTPAPIHYLVKLLKGYHEKTIQDGMYGEHIDAHYLVYLRDTTFERLRTELFRGVGGVVPYPTRWIVPPRYDSLIENASLFIMRAKEAAEPMAATLTTDVYSAFDRAVLDGTELSAATHMNFVFGSNARRMKHHIRQILSSALQRASLTSNYDFTRFSSGIEAKAVWQELVSAHSIKNLPRYVLLEDLFLSESRQLFPKLELDWDIVKKIIDDGDIDRLVFHIRDRGETVGVFGCILNYCYPASISASDNKEQPALLLLVRTLQYIRENHRCNAGEVYEFISKIGYRITEEACHFIIFVLIRTELIKWDGTSGARSIRNVPFYITTKGIILLRKFLFSITYLSEAVISSLHLDRGITRYFIGRNQDSSLWVADCVNNASIALYAIRLIEEIEEYHAARSHVDFSIYKLYDDLILSQKSEAGAILRNAKANTLRQWERNTIKLDDLRRLDGRFVILGEE